MLAVGFLASVKLHDFFYPSQNAKQEQQYVQDGGNGGHGGKPGKYGGAGYRRGGDYMRYPFCRKSLDLTDSSREEEESPIPEQYIGMDRDEFLSAMNSYSESPSLNDLNKGFLAGCSEVFRTGSGYPEKIMKAKEMYRVLPGRGK